MCGRARCTVRVGAVSTACGFRAPLRSVNADRYNPSYNVAPGAYMPVVRYDSTGDNREPVVHCMRWGLVPSFTKKSEKPDFYRMFNARSESVQQKSSFRRLVPKNRCLATVEGFYEWKKDGKKKQPYYVHMSDGKTLVFAALYDSWEDAEGEKMYTFTILTTRVSKRLEWLHGCVRRLANDYVVITKLMGWVGGVDRMPVVLGSQDAINSWLNDDLSEDALHKLTQPYEASDLVWYPVTPAMGRPAFNGPECVEEIKPKVASESTIAQLFGKRIVQDNSRMSDQGPSKETEDGLDLSEEDQKALLAGMVPDQDVIEAMQKSEGDLELDGNSKEEKVEDASHRDDQIVEVSETLQEDVKDVQGSILHPSARHGTSERGGSPLSDQKHAGTQSSPSKSVEMKPNPLTSPVKPKGRKSADSKDEVDMKRRRTSDYSKGNGKSAQTAGTKEKQSNLLGFFTKQ